jgi:transposase, IS30 family
MKKYSHLDLQDRHKIKALLEAGHSQSKIAEIIGVHKSTVSRELSRSPMGNEPRPEHFQYRG